MTDVVQRRKSINWEDWRCSPPTLTHTTAGRALADAGGTVLPAQLHIVSRDAAVPLIPKGWTSWKGSRE